MALEDGRDMAELPHSGNETVKELVDQYGAEAVKRGLNYMASLSEAEENFVENVSREDMEEGYKEAGVEGDTSAASSEWQEQVSESGLGLEDE